MSQLLEEDHIEEGSFSRAYVRSSFDELRQDHELSNETANALIAALASNPKLLEPLRTHFAEWNEQTRKEKGDRVGLTIARLAADALMIMPAFGYGDFPPELTEQIKKRLIEMTLPKRPVKRPAR